LLVTAKEVSLLTTVQNTPSYWSWDQSATGKAFVQTRASPQKTSTPILPLLRRLAVLTQTVCRQNISDIWFDILESVWLIWFEGSGCDCLPMQAASLFDCFAF
jgi:hypothetical protein